MGNERKPSSGLAIQVQEMMWRFFGERLGAEQADKYAAVWMENRESLRRRISDPASYSYGDLEKVIQRMDRRRQPPPTPLTLLERHLKIKFRRS